MAKFDLSNVSFVDLIELRGEIEASIDSRRKEEKQQLINEIQRMIEEKGFSVADIFGESDFVKKSSVPAKYKNPDNPEEKWSGRGRKPRWVIDQMKQGNSLENLRIDK